jgi:hypothetical protein
MPTDPPDDFDALVEALDTIPGTAFGPLRTALASEIARRAQTHGGALAYYAHLQEAESAMFGGSPHVAITAFVKALAAFGELPEPSAYAHDRLIRHFKWVLEESVGVAALPRAQIDGLIADYEARARAAGSNGREALLVRRTWAMHRRAANEVADLQARLQRTPRDPLQDCPPCETDRWARWLADRGDHVGALKAGKPILEGLICSEVPGRTFAGLLTSWLTTGDRAAAATFHRRGLRLCGSNPYYLGQIGQHLAYLVAADCLPAAMRLLNRHLEVARSAESTEAAFSFWGGARSLLRRTERGAQSTAAEAEAALTTAAEVLDRRNGTDGFGRLAGAPETNHGERGA